MHENRFELAKSKCGGKYFQGKKNILNTDRQKAGGRHETYMY